MVTAIFKRLFGTDDGETSEFKTFVEDSVEDLRAKTDEHQKAWQFGEEGRWDFSQQTGELILTHTHTIIRAPAQIVGTLDNTAGNWMWGWANPSITQALMRDSVRVREYGEEKGIYRLVTPTWTAEEMDCWDMAALANRLCEKNGVYRAPAGNTFVFFTFGEVQISKRAES